jgi:hypothetical protein
MLAAPLTQARPGPEAAERSPFERPAVVRASDIRSDRGRMPALPSG